jgi:uncharacterized heparinase superfamily protein
VKAKIDQALLLARTVRHLAPSQVAHRIRLRGQKAALAAAPGLIAPRLQRRVSAIAGWPEGYVALDGRLAQGYPSAEANAEGRFRFLERERSLGDPPSDWDHADADQLWRYHLHYFEWAWAFVNHPDREWARDAFLRLWQSWWGHTTFGRWDAWSPYVVSLRAWALCGAYRPLIAGGPDGEAFRSHLGLHAGFVRANLELDVGGNHLIKNAKALVGLGVFLDDRGLVDVGVRHLERQIAVQVLPDGGHFELSPSYHCQVLGDLIDVHELLTAAGLPPVAGLSPAVEAMRRWLGVMLLPDGDVPMFNDCVLVGHDRIKLLEPTPPPRQRLVVLQPSGYVVMRPDDRMHLVADVGPPCPPGLPAHAHADCLSFELAVDGQRILVNSGTSTYEPGPRRAYERSTRAHNTVEIDGRDQTEVWGTFRAGRRASATLERVADDGSATEVVGSHAGYRRLPGGPVHRREWRASPTTIEIIDQVSGGASHRVLARLHLSPGVETVPRSRREFQAGPIEIAFDDCSVERTEATVARRFGEALKAAVLTAEADGVLPRRLRTVLTVEERS